MISKRKLSNGGGTADDVVWELSDPELLSGSGDETTFSDSGEDTGTSDDEDDIVEATDTSDEEEVRNTRGNIPLEWYDELPHFGYNTEGEKITKLSSTSRDELDEFLAKMDDENYWKTVKDTLTGEEVVLTDEQIDMIQRLQQSCYPEHCVDAYEPYVDHFTSEKQLLPLSLIPKPKSSFIPSKWEHRKIIKLMHAIRMGWIKPHTQGPLRPAFYQLWDESGSDDRKRRHGVHIPAPRIKLPGHAESYNPPPEYLPTQKEREEWLATDEEDRPTNFLPQKFNSLREVPAYSLFIKERFERCLDLYLCPRQRKMRVQVSPDDLLPKLPHLSDLQPFPSTESLLYQGHSGVVQCVCVEPHGQWLASAAADCTVKMWEVATGRCEHTLIFPSKPVALCFSPNVSHTLLAVAVAEQIFIINSQLGDRVLVKNTTAFLDQLPFSMEPVVGGVVWGYEQDAGRIHVTHNKPVQQVCWHSKGDYLAAVSADVSGSSVYIHQVSKLRSQVPFRKLKGQVQRVLFHPHKPLFFIATQTCVRVYNLVVQQLVKRLLSGVKWISCMALHPTGDHLLLGSYDKKLCWFDLDLSSKPYKILRQHKQAVRAVSFHSLFPLFASGSDDGSVVVCHGKTFNDLLHNPQIVPVKMLRGSRVVDGLGALDVVFHPTQPWLFTAGADSSIRLYCN